MNTFPCSKCRDSCCGVNTPFSKKDIDNIKKKSKKLLRSVTITPDKGMYTLSNKTPSELENNSCKIYDIRPSVCKAYGNWDALPCPFANMKDIPESKEERQKLIIKSQIDGMEALQKHFGTNLPINYISSDVRNVIK